MIKYLFSYHSNLFTTLVSAKLSALIWDTDDTIVLILNKFLCDWELECCAVCNLSLRLWGKNLFQIQLCCATAPVLPNQSWIVGALAFSVVFLILLPLLRKRMFHAYLFSLSSFLPNAFCYLFIYCAHKLFWSVLCWHNVLSLTFPLLLGEVLLAICPTF